jgi:hypothetical protein
MATRKEQRKALAKRNFQEQEKRPKPRRPPVPPAVRSLCNSRVSNERKRDELALERELRRIEGYDFDDL